METENTKKIINYDDLSPEEQKKWDDNMMRQYKKAEQITNERINALREQFLQGMDASEAQGFLMACIHRVTGRSYRTNQII